MNFQNIMDHDYIIQLLIKLGRQIRQVVTSSLHQQSLQERTSIHRETQGDTIYQIDQDVDPIITREFAANAEILGGVVLIAEGVSDEMHVFPESMPENEAQWRILIDPIDGTREIMYDKRSAFFLAGAAPNKGNETRLQDIEVAVMLELPPTFSYRSEIFWAKKGKGTHRLIENLHDGNTHSSELAPSIAKSIYGGFAQISRFFHPGKEVLAALEAELVGQLFPDAPANRAYLFEDQYLSTGGQLYELLVGHYRFTADLRAALFQRYQNEGKAIGLCAHPYDLCAHLIGNEAGLIITDAKGNPLDGPFDTTSNMDWIGYANPHIQQEIQPNLRELLKKYKMI